MLSLIAVIGKNRELGKDNKLLWHIPGDLPRFKKLTMGHPVIMGRITFESIGKPLEGRINIVVSQSIPGIRAASIPGISVVSSIEAALALAKKSPGNEEIFVIGGGKIFEQTIAIADRLYLTAVDKEAVADTFFPEYSRFAKKLKEEKQDWYSYIILEP